MNKNKRLVMKRNPAGVQTYSKVPLKKGRTPPSSLFSEIRELILSARCAAARVVNTLQVTTNFEIGRRIVEHEQKGLKRAEYGAALIKELSVRLTEEFGRGFSTKSLRRMIQFASVFPDLKIVASLMRQLSWTHFLQIIYIKNDLQREFYTQMCLIGREMKIKKQLTNLKMS